MYHKSIVKGKKIHNKLGIILKERSMSQREFSRVTGIRQATINEIVNNKKNSIQFDHLTLIMCTLELENFNCIFEIIEVEESVEI